MEPGLVTPTRRERGGSRRAALVAAAAARARARRPTALPSGVGMTSGVASDEHTEAQAAAGSGSTSSGGEAMDCDGEGRDCDGDTGTRRRDKRLLTRGWRGDKRGGGGGGGGGRGGGGGGGAG